MTYRALSRNTFITTLFISTVKYTVQVYTPNTRVNSDYLLTVRIRGTGGLTVDHALHGATQETQGYGMFLFCSAEYYMNSSHTHK